jgi:hypothetical protein
LFLMRLFGCFFHGHLWLLTEFAVEERFEEEDGGGDVD